MSAYIPVAPDRWAEMVQASAEVGPLRNKVSDLSTQLELRQVEIDRLRAEVERLRKAGEWQPIETSPDSNALILIMHKDKEVEIIYASDLCHYYINTYPTHWMPLPAAPAAKEGRDAK